MFLCFANNTFINFVYGIGNIITNVTTDKCQLLLVNYSSNHVTQWDTIITYITGSLG